MVPRHLPDTPRPPAANNVPPEPDGCITFWRMLGGRPRAGRTPASDARTRHDGRRFRIAPATPFAAMAVRDGFFGQRGLEVPPPHASRACPGPPDSEGRDASTSTREASPECTDHFCICINAGRRFFLTQVYAAYASVYKLSSACFSTFVEGLVHWRLIQSYLRSLVNTEGIIPSKGACDTFNKQAPPLFPAPLRDASCAGNDCMWERAARRASAGRRPGRSMEGAENRGERRGGPASRETGPPVVLEGLARLAGSGGAVEGAALQKLVQAHGVQPFEQGLAHFLPELAGGAGLEAGAAGAFGPAGD